MPFTPFHLGLGGVSGGYASRWFSFRAFCFANVLIDLEALYRLPLMLYPVHDWLHTFAVGPLLALLLWFPLGKPFCLLVSRWWNKKAAGSVLERIHIAEQIKMLPAMVGVVIGGVSHVFLDGIMHSDIEPLRPFSLQNPFYRLLDVRELHIALVTLGLVGVSFMVFRCRKK